MASSTTPSSTTEKPSYGTPDFRVEDKLFAHIRGFPPSTAAAAGGALLSRAPFG